MKKRPSELPLRLALGHTIIHGVDWGELNVSHVHFPVGVDAVPLLEGMPGDLCQCPHWGYVLKGSIHVRYTDGTEEVVRAGELYYWPPGHTVWVDEDYQALELSPAAEMDRVLTHLERRAAEPQPETPP